ncbi:DUF1643 domain-containing protein [Neoaquamicrobium sediminum]|uniref:DUF1643 domain-containing protein n=1 Tax=Neoaquamicrobium sediminum TaxID=1849104 RepID=UPI001564D123|nr:DUF1643 domain-containing protein [Mesorhizobium sediminum]NRC54173.1 DUF1643 domain-containing protein [Mesorhizobium sediminum]
MGTVLSPCFRYRYRLERGVSHSGPVYAYFGVNGSTADADEDDHTVRKWRGFTAQNGGSRFIVGNAFAYRATDVRELAKAGDPVGHENARYLAQIIAEADILVPCWGSRNKVPAPLRFHFDNLADMLFVSGKPVLVWGFTASGDPLHPLTLSYETALKSWRRNDELRYDHGMAEAARRCRENDLI